MTLELDDAWTEIRAALREAVGERTFQLWLAPLECRELTPQRIALGGPPAVTAWASERLGHVLRSCAETVLGRDVTIAIDGAQLDGEPDVKPVDDGLIEDLTFERFVIGASNHLAHAAALAIAESPGQVFNPLFIYGPPGLGKTHLLHAIGNYVRRHSAGLSVRYTTAEAYTSAFVDAVRSRSTVDFKRRFRRADVLLLDDVQFLERKTQTEEEFFHTFNALHSAGSQLVITSDRTPGDLGGLEARLRERFEAGLVTAVETPDFAMRLAILRRFAASNAFAPGDAAVLETVARHVDANVRLLEGALTRVVAFASLRGRGVETDVVAEALDTLPAAQRARGVLTLDQIQQTVAAHFDLSVKDLLSRSRSPRLAWPRHAAIYLARRLTPHSLQAIGAQFGGRDHSTVLHAWRQTERRIAADERAAADINSLISQLDPGSAVHTDFQHAG